jgi:hypothetical protein
VSYGKLADSLISGINASDKDRWIVNGSYDATSDQMQTALLRDIAISLRAIRATLDCQNTIDIPRILRAIRANTAKPRRKSIAKKRARKGGQKP